MDNIYNSIIEALIFSSDEPLSGNDIIKAIKGIDGEDTEITLSDIENCVNSLNENYLSQNNAFNI